MIDEDTFICRNLFCHCHGESENDLSILMDQPQEEKIEELEKICIDRSKEILGLRIENGYLRGIIQELKKHKDAGEIFY